MNFVDVQNVTGEAICDDLFEKSPFERLYGGRPSWLTRIAAFFNISIQRADDLSRGRVKPNGAEKQLYFLVKSGQISLSTIINQDIQRMEAKYERLR